MKIHDMRLVHLKTGRSDGIIFIALPNVMKLNQQKCFKNMVTISDIS